MEPPSTDDLGRWGAPLTKGNLLPCNVCAHSENMKSRYSATFRDYLRSLPDELLQSVSEDYIWLSAVDFENEPATEFRVRRECCREECVRRGAPQLYQIAEHVISPWAA